MLLSFLTEATAICRLINRVDATGKAPASLKRYYKDLRGANLLDSAVGNSVENRRYHRL